MYPCLFFACVYYPKKCYYITLIYTHLIWLCLGSHRIGIHILVFMTSTSLSVTLLPCFHILIIPHNPTPDQRWAPSTYNPRATDFSLGISLHRTDLVKSFLKPDRDRA